LEEELGEVEVPAVEEFEALALAEAEFVAPGGA